MSNPVFEAVRTVLAVREFQDREIPVEILHRIVEAGRLSASSMNLQPWHFVVVKNRETIRELAPLAKTGPYIAAAPAAIVVAVEGESQYALSDASRAIQSMILTAWADGIGSNWVGFANLEDVARRVGLPDTHRAIAVLPFGYPTRTLGKGKKKRKALSEVASLERFGEPLQ